MKNFFLKYKSPVTVLLVLIIGGGLFTYSKLQTALFPEITFPKIKIIADAGLQPVDKMVITVTKPVENAIKQVPDLKTIRSTTSRGSCEISAFLNEGANVDDAVKRIESKINEIKNALPAGAQMTVEKMNPSILPVSGYTLESHSMTPIELRLLADYTVKPFLSQVEGVSEVRITGGKQKEYWVQLNQQKMISARVSPDAVTMALSNTNFIQSNGLLSDYRYLYLTVTDATVHTIDELKNIIVQSSGTRVLRLGDIADVSVRESVQYTLINANGKDAVLVGIIKQPNANLIQVSTDMQKKVAGLRKILPKGVSIQPYYIQADFVNGAVKSVSDSLWLGLLLAIIVAIIFLRSVKASFTILITIPITLGLTLLVLYAGGFTLNIMTLGAIAAAIGLIIDDAVVVVEQIHRTHEENPGEGSAPLVHKAIHFLLPAMIGSSVSTIVIFIPFALMTGVAGSYFKILTDTMIITLICSFFVTWIGLPVVYLLLSRKKPKENKKTEKAHWVKQQKWVTFFILRPWISITIMVILGLVIYMIPSRLSTGFLPEMDEGSIVLDYTSPPGTSLDETDRMLREVEKIIVRAPEVSAYSRRTGTQMGFFITEPNTGDYLIQLKKDRQRSTDEVIADLRQKIEATQPALRIDFGQVMEDMLGDLMTSVQPIEIKIYGNEQSILQHISRQVADVVSGIKGTADVFDGIVIAGPSVDIIPNYNRLAQFGMTPMALQQQLQLGLEGNIAGTIQEKEQMTPIRTLYPGSQNRDLTSVRQQKIFLPSGNILPVSSLAQIKINPGDVEIERENLQSIGSVTARLDNSDLGTVMKEIQKEVSSKVSLPAGYHITYGGAFAEQQSSFRELLIILIIASISVFGVILFLYRDIRVAFAILLIAVLGISGSFLGLYFTNTPLNVGSYTGLIMIVGIIGENAIFTFLQYLESRATAGVDEAIVYAISTRLRPKLMTAFGAITALFPLALGIGTGAQLHQPLAIAVIGGFIVALPLLLIVLPSILRFLLHKKNIANQ